MSPGRLSIMFAITSALIFAGGSAYALQKPLQLSGNLGYYYTYSQTDGGARGENTYFVGALNADSYLYRPWFATLNLGGTGSSTYSAVEANSKQSYLMSSRATFRLLPLSRVPLTLSYYSNNDLDPNTSSASYRDLLGYGFKTRFFGAMQRFIGRGGNQVDIWYHNRMRGAEEIGDLTDQTVGGKIKSRYANHNFYATGTYQAREGGFTEKSTRSRNVSLMHNYVPSSQFYVKTLGSHTNYNDKSGRTNGSFIANSTTDVNQASSFFYWRPVYKPYVFNGAVRLHQRQLTDNVSADINDNRGANGLLAGTYKINRRTQLTASFNASVLDTDRANTLSANQSVQMQYQSDSILYRGASYRWFSNGGIGNDASSEKNKSETDERDYDLSQNLNAGVGHSANKRWVTGNRSTMRASVTQQVREYFATRDFGSIFTLSHTGSLSWNLDARQGNAYAQAAVMDTRSFFDDSLEMQIVNFQLSRSMPISRLSAWSGNLSMQSSRREDGASEKGFIEGFLSVATGRLSYQHSRLFGIYKLKFRTKLDLSATVNRAGGDRKQVDWENQLGYRIGK
ncbi:MAG: hypothetical protein OEX19_09720, partial [Gammaproteobacteria bacterium]|nr:hypothetical protein [Gammaproteobacteria bacterium]